MTSKRGRVVTCNKELPFINSCPFLVILISLIRFVGLEHKHPSRHRLLVLFKTETMLKKQLDKKFARIYFCGQRNKRNFAETNFRGFAKKPRNLRKLIHAKINFLKAFK